MKCLGRLDSMVMAAALLFSACTGGSGGDGDNNPPPDDKMPPPKADSLERNPSQPLSCDRQITENPATSPLSRLTDKEYLNSVKDLLGNVVADGDLPKLAELKIDALFPGHSVFVLRNGQKHIARALNKLTDFVLPESFFETNEFMWQSDYRTSLD